MALHSLRDILDRAAEGAYGVGAFNVTDELQAAAVLDAAAETNSPVIVQTIAGASAHATDERFWHTLRALIDTYPEVPVALHLDHGTSFDSCRRAIEAGFTSVMIDGSLDPVTHAPASFEANVEVTAQVVAYAASHHVSVEGELGTIGGVETDGASVAEIVLATPDEAVAFVEAAPVDALAVAIGTSHGAYKFMTPPDSSVLHVDLIGEIAAVIPNTHLVMHGSSSLPKDLRDKINAHGGALPESWGVPDEEKPRAIRMGIRKVNQGMDSHMALMAAVRQELARDRVAVDPSPALSAGRIGMQRIVAERMELFGQSGQAYRHLG